MIREKLNKLGQEVGRLYVGGAITALTVILKEGIPRAVLTWLQVFTGVLLAGQSGLAPQTLGEFGWETAIAVANVSALVAIITSLRFLASNGLNGVPTQEVDYEELFATYEAGLQAHTPSPEIIEDVNNHPHLVEAQPVERLEIESTADEKISSLTPDEAVEQWGRQSQAAKEADQE